MKTLVLASGGLDSTVCLGIALHDAAAEDVAALCVCYGQKHDRELEHARLVCEHYHVRLDLIDLTSCFASSQCTLLKGSKSDVQCGSYAEQLADGGRVQTYVPFRNGLILSVAAAFCESLFPEQKSRIFIGSHLDDASAAGHVAYPDCSPEFDDAMNRAVNIGTYGDVCIEAPLRNMTKADVVAQGMKLSVPFELTWSCYNGGDKPCGKCGTCIDRQKAFERCHIEDPALL